MDPKIDQCPDLTAEDVARLRAVEAGMYLTADVSRSDLLLCCLLASNRGLIARHVMPSSIASLYPQEATGAVFSEGAALVMRVLHGGRSGSGADQGSRAPIVRMSIGRQPGRHRDPARWLCRPICSRTNAITGDGISSATQSAACCACAPGELECAQSLSRFGLYDGIYLVDRTRTVLYMSGISANLFRSAGLTVDVEGQRVADLEPLDEEMVDVVLGTGTCLEERRETPDGRVWVRTALPLCMSAQEMPFFYWPRWRQLLRRQRPASTACVLLHNATGGAETARAKRQIGHHSGSPPPRQNNLQTIAAILRIQARRSESEEARQQLGEAVNRILSVSVIHEFLSEDEHRPINIRDLADRIVGQVSKVTGVPGQQIDIRVHGPSVRLPAGQATPVAMVINELVLNAVEHGLQGHQTGQIDIALQDLGDSVRVTVANSGSGLRPTSTRSATATWACRSSVRW